MSLQYYMRAYKTSDPASYIGWVVNDTPDILGIYSGYDTGVLTNITINKISESKVNNFLKPLNSADGYFLHINSYDWLHLTPPGPPIPVPNVLTGISIVRGSEDGALPRDYASLFWDEDNQRWKFSFIEDGYYTSVGDSLSLNVKDSIIDGYAIFGETPSQSGTIRLPNNSSLSFRNSVDSDDLLGISNNGEIIQLGNISGVSSIVGRNISLLSPTGSFGGGNGVIFISNSIAPPSTDPIDGSILYAEDGYLKYRNPLGTTVSLTSNAFPIIDWSSPYAQPDNWAPSTSDGGLWLNSSVGTPIFRPILLTHGATVTSVKARILPAGGHVGLPATMPVLYFGYRDSTGSFVIIDTQEDTSLDVTAYQLTHEIEITGLTEVVNTALNEYIIALVSEDDVNALVGTKFINSSHIES